jgi:hypothetical protein
VITIRNREEYKRIQTRECELMLEVAGIHTEHNRR